LNYLEEYQDDGSLLIDIRMQQVDWSKLEKREETPLSYFLVTNESAQDSLSS
jgi:GTP-binding protein HflX